MRDSLLYCCNIQLWESLNDFDHKPGNISQTSDRLFCKKNVMERKTPKCPCNADFKSAAGLVEEGYMPWAPFPTCIGHVIGQLVVLNYSFYCHNVYFLDGYHTVFIFCIYLPSQSADKMLENSMPVPFDSKVYWFLNNFFDSWQLFISAWCGWSMKNQLLTAGLAFIFIVYHINVSVIHN